VTRALQLVRLLADGGCHSGEALAAELGVSRAAVWKAVEGARSRLGVAIEAVRGRGYRLAAPLELLDARVIGGRLAGRGGPSQAPLEVHDQLDSTNSRLMELARQGAPSGSVCLAELQTAGRGRCGRTWVTPFGAGLALSLLWRSALGPGRLGGLSLAAGAVVAEVLSAAGVAGIELKWPNDVLWQRRKLAGLLLEVAGEAEGPSHLVLGLGVNLRLPAGAGDGIDQPWCDLAQALGGRLPGRNALAADLIGGLWAAAETYGREGIAPFRARWSAFDRLQGAPVELRSGAARLAGIHRGIDDDGALLLETEAGVRPYHAGEVSLRTA
jgi:BirA family biotin operon repressor/biotin-[acetyl-CoA-carboxylase] ligase